MRTPLGTQASGAVAVPPTAWPLRPGVPRGVGLLPADPAHTLTPAQARLCSGEGKTGGGLAGSPRKSVCVCVCVCVYMPVCAVICERVCICVSVCVLTVCIYVCVYVYKTGPKKPGITFWRVGPL